jgi:hypothetical protein
MDNNGFVISVGTVREVENVKSKDGYDGLRIRASLYQDECGNKKIKTEDIPWAFPLLPKVFQSVPKKGEAVLIFSKNKHPKDSTQRYYIGPIIAQPQYFSYSQKENATALLKQSDSNPIAKMTHLDDTRGAFPNENDIAVIGRGREDVTLKYDDKTKTSEVDIRAGIRTEPLNSINPNIIGNIIFNDVDPAYIQLKYKNGLATKGENSANSIINMVANRINIMSNKDSNIAHNLNDKDMLVVESKMDEIMDSLHQVPMGDKLVELLTIMKGAIMHHVHPWAGMEQCGDWPGYIKKLDGYDIDSILSDYVRIS